MQRKKLFKRLQRFSFSQNIKNKLKIYTKILRYVYKHAYKNIFRFGKIKIIGI